METIQTERRVPRTGASTAPGPAASAAVLSQAILLQTSVGTLGAVEYLKSHRVDCQVINRLLSNGFIRKDDQFPPGVRGA